MQTKLNHLLIAFCTISITSFGQPIDLSTNKPAPDFSKLAASSDKPESEIKSGPILINNINAKALRDFVRSYQHPSDVVWTALPDGFRVHFYSDDIQTRIFYDQKGNRLAMIRYYREDKLPHDVRYLVKSNYYDYSIFNVTEVSKNGKTVYFVKLESDSEWKTIRLDDDEMDETESYSKN